MGNVCRLAAASVVFCRILVFPYCAYPLPEGQNVESGSVTFESPNPSTLNIIASDKAIINFNSFNIAANETVNFIQPSSTASVLSRVSGNSISNINGSLVANGILFLTNPHGINFGANAEVRVNSFIASTLEISANNFINGNYVLERGQSGVYARILNEGIIEGNNIAFVASAVDNIGIVRAIVGTVHLVSGDKAAVTVDRSGFIQVEINEETSGKVYDENGNAIQGAVKNSGALEAARVVMSAKTARDIFKNAVNQSGIIKAESMVEESGVIRIKANHNIDVSGVLEAKGGADVYIDTPEVLTIDAKINTENGAIKIGSETQPSEILGSPHYAHTAGNMEITEKGSGLIKTTRGDVLRYNSENNLTLEAVNGNITDLTPAGITANSLKLIANGFSVNSSSFTTHIYKNAGDFTIQDANIHGDLVTLEGKGLKATYLKAGNLILQSDNAINTNPGVIIQASQIRFIAKQFGSLNIPLVISAADTYINRIAGSIEIMESLGLGTSILLRGPPDGFGAIIYSPQTNLILRADSVSLSREVEIRAENIIIAAEKEIYSLGALKAEASIFLLSSGPTASLGTLQAKYLNEAGAAFKIGGKYSVGTANIKNTDNAVTLVTGEYSGETSDIADINVDTNAVITLIGNTVFRADSDQNGAGAFTMNSGSSVVGGGYTFTLYTSQTSALRSISGTGTLTLSRSQAASTPTYTQYSDVSVSGNLTIDSGVTLAFDTSAAASRVLTVNGDINVNGTFNVYSNSSASYSTTVQIQSASGAEHGIIVSSTGSLNIIGTSKADQDAIITRTGSYNSYIYLQNGSETTIRYADISYMGDNAETKFGIYVASIDNTTAGEGFIIEDSKVHNGYTGIWYVSGDDHTAIIGNEIYSNSVTGLYLRYSDFLLIADNKIYNNTYSGIFLASVDNSTIRGNSIYDNTYDGIRLDNSTNNYIYNNTINSNDLDGIFFQNAGAIGNIAKNNILSNNIDDGIDDDAAIGQNTYNYNNHYGNGTSYEGPNTIGANSITSNPNFEGATDFDLQEGSPALGAGVDIVAGTVPGTINMGAGLGYSRNSDGSNGPYNYLQQAASDSGTNAGDTITTYAVDEASSTISGSVTDAGFYQYFTSGANIAVDDDYVGYYLYASSGNNKGEYYQITDTVASTDTIYILDKSGDNSFISGDGFTIVDRVYTRDGGTEIFELNHNSGTDGSPITYTTSGTVILDGENTKRAVIDMGFNDSWLVINGFVIENATTYAGIYFGSSGANSVISNNIIYSNSSYGIGNNNKNNITIENNEVFGNSSVGITLTGFYNIIRNNVIHNNLFGIGGDNTNTVISNNTVYSNNYGVRLISPNNLVANNIIYSNTGAGYGGIYLQGVGATNNTIVNNFIYSNSFGVYMNSGPVSNRVYNNTINNNTSDGIRFSSSVSANTIINNIISNNGGYGIRDSNNSGLITNTYNNIYNNTSGATYQITAGIGAITTNPNFEGATDFDLQEGSPALGAGVDIVEGTVPGTINMGAELGYIRNSDGSNGAFNYLQQAHDDAGTGAGDILTAYTVNEQTSTISGSITDDGNYQYFTAGSDIVSSDDNYIGYYLYFSSGNNIGKYYQIVDAIASSDTIYIADKSGDSSFASGDAFTIIDRVYSRLGSNNANLYLTKDGTSGSPITWVANGTIIIDADNTRTYGIYADGADYNTLNGFIAENAVSHGFYINNVGGESITLQNTVIYVNGGDGINLAAGTLNLTGTNTVNDSISNSGTLVIQGDPANFTFNSLTNNSGSIVTYAGDGDSAADTFTIKDVAYYHLTINSTDNNDIFQLGATLNMDGTLTVAQGIFSLNNYNIADAVGGDTAARGNIAGTIRLRGNETVFWTANDTDSGTYEYVGNGDAGVNTYTIKKFGAIDYYNLTINSADGITDTFQLGNSIVVQGKLAVSSGSFVSGANTLTLQGASASYLAADIVVADTNWTSGTLVILSDTDQVLPNNETYNNLQLGRDAGTSATVYTVGSGVTISGTGIIDADAKVVLTASAAGDNKVYNGNITATVTLSDDNIFTNYTNFTKSYGSAVFADKNTGTAKAVSVSGIALGGADSGYFQLSATTAVATADIAAKVLTVIGITADNKVYDGGTAAVLNTVGAALSGVAGGDTVTLNTASATGVFDTQNIGTGKGVIISGLTISGSDSGNYSLTQPTTTADITSVPAAADNPAVRVGESCLFHPNFQVIFALYFSERMKYNFFTNPLFKER